MAYSSTSSLVVSLLILSSVFSHLPLHVYTKGGFSVDLIHRDSPDSPLYDPTSTASSRLKSAVERSRSRAKYFGNAIQNPIAAADNFYSEITPGNYEYLMSFYLGSPAEKIVAIADTGSDLIWIQCKPCDECYHQTAHCSTHKPPPPTKSSRAMQILAQPCLREVAALHPNASTTKDTVMVPSSMDFSPARPSALTRPEDVAVERLNKILQARERELRMEQPKKHQKMYKAYFFFVII